jgi:hypothetical protein
MFFVLVCAVNMNLLRTYTFYVKPLSIHELNEFKDVQIIAECSEIPQLLTNFVSNKR